MARSGQNKGSIRTKFPVFNKDWNQNHVEWLIEKFGGYVGEIKASDVRKKGCSNISCSKYRELVELAVINGRAYSNGKSVDNNKYAIYFNSSNSLIENEKLFDKELLLHPVIIDLPPRCYRVDVDARSWICWVETKTYWTYLYQLICGFQKEGKVNLDILPSYLDPNTKSSLGLEARMYIYIYKALKFGWDEMPRVFKLYGDNYNIIFLDILQKSIFNNLSMKLSDFNLSSPSYLYKCVEDIRQELYQLKPSDGSFLDREKLYILKSRQTEYNFTNTSVHPY